MSAGADIYQQLLGIGPTVPRPLTIYGLLGTAEFEANTTLLLNRIELQRKKLTRFTQPELQTAVARLSEMLGKAEQIVRSPDLKARYDAKLRGSSNTSRVAARPTEPQPAKMPSAPVSATNQALPPIHQGVPVAPPPTTWPQTAPNDSIMPLIQVAPRETGASAARGPRKSRSAGNPLVWGLVGLGVALLAGITVLLWPREREPIAKVDKPSPPVEVPAAPKRANPTPSPLVPAEKPPVPVTPAPAIPQEPEPDPRRVGKILSTGSKASNYLVANEELQVTQTKAFDEYLVFGDDLWRDYDFEFEICADTKSTAICPLGIVIHCPDHNVIGSVEKLWGSEAQMRMRLVEGGKNDDFFISDFDSPAKASFTPGTWHKFHVTVRGKNVTVRRDDKEIFNKLVDSLPYRGQVGFHVGSIRDFVTRFRNIKVTDPEGNQLWSGLPVPERNYTATPKLKPFTEATARVDLAKMPRREVPENQEIVYRFDGQTKDGWAVPGEISGAEEYWFIEDGKLTNKTGQTRGYSALRLDQPPLRNFVFKARLTVVADGFHLFFRAPPLYLENRKGVEFLLRRDGTSGVFHYPSYLNDASTASAPEGTFELEVIAAEDCFEAKLNGKTINFHRTRISTPQQGSLWISSQGGKNKVLIEQLQVTRLPDDFKRLEPAEAPNNVQFVWKYDGGQFVRQPNSSWIATNDQGERAIYLEKTRNDFYLELQDFEGKTRIRLRDADSELSHGPFGSFSSSKHFRLQHNGHFVGPNLRQIPPADLNLNEAVARADASLSPAQATGLESVLSALRKEQALAAQQETLLFQQYQQGLDNFRNPTWRSENKIYSQIIDEYIDMLRRTSQLSKKPKYLALAPQLYKINLPLLQGITEYQARLNRFYTEQIAQLNAAGKPEYAERLQELQRLDPLAQPLELFTVQYNPTPLVDIQFLTCLSDYTIREFPEQRMTWEYVNEREIVIRGANEKGRVTWQDQLRFRSDDASNPLQFRYGTNKSGKLYSVLPRGIGKK